MATINTAVVILAAGKGNRMKSDLPKVLHPVGGLPMIKHVLAAADSLAPERVVVVLGANSSILEELVQPAVVAIQDPPLGTGHALLSARDALTGFTGDLFVLFGDTPLITPETLQAMRQALHLEGKNSRPCLVVLGFRPDDPGQYGRLVCAPDGTLKRIVEFGDATPAERDIGLCNSGVMAFDGAVLFALLEQLSPRNVQGEYYLTDVIGLANQAGLRCAVVEGSEEELLGINSRADLARAEALIQNRLRAEAMAAGVTLIDPGSVYLSCDTVFGQDVTIEPHVFFGPGVTVGTGTTVKAFSHIEGADIGAGATVGPFARLRPGAQIHSGARIGNFVEIKNAIIEDGAKVGHLSYIGDARVGEKANIGAGTITCNYDGFDKFQTDIGAGAFIGSNTALIAPVKVGDGAVVGAGSVVREDVAGDALSVARTEQKHIVAWARRFRERKKSDKAARSRAKTKAAE